MGLKELEQELRITKEALNLALKRIEELEVLVKEKSVPAFVKKEPKISGQKNGHVGYSRHVPERIDEIKEHKLEECSICGEQVSDTQEIRELTLR